MWLSRVELKNFKSYRDQVFEFPQPANGRNLVLIGGINGYGKTTLLEAIYAGLYGDEAIKHKALESAGLKTKSYGHFLEAAFHRLAPSEGRELMEVCVEFTREDNQALRVTRKWFFKSTGKFDTQKVIIETCSSAGGCTLHKPELLSELLESHAIPPWLASFFFFDGEKISGLADEDRTGWIQSGLENLLGVVLVKELRAKLTDYIDKKLRDAGGIDEQRVSELKSELDKKRTEEALLSQKLISLHTEMDKTKQEGDRFSRQLTELAPGSDARTVAEVAEKRAKAEQRVEQCWNDLRKLYSVQLPLQLIRKKLYESLNCTLTGEQILTEWEQSKARMLPNWEKFRKTFFDSQWIGALCHLPGARDDLEKTLTEAWDSLHSPRPSECALTIWHDYLQANERQKLEDMRTKSLVSATHLRQALKAHENAENEKSQLNTELIRLEGAGGNDKKQQREKLLHEFQKNRDELDRLGPYIGSKDNELQSLKRDVYDRNAIYERERKKLVEGHPERQAARQAEKIVEMIDGLLPRLFEIKLEALSKAVTRIFRELHHKDQVARIEISREGSATLFSHEEVKIDLPKSSGESQLFVLALVSALAEVTGYRVPMIIDTPLARLSKQHCKNLLQHWISDPNRQVILLAQDKEIDFSEYQALNDSVSKTYLLHHHQIREGVGSSEAIANEYFRGVV